MKIKTGPKVVIALAIICAAGWWANGYIDARQAARAKQAPEQAVVQPTQPVVVASPTDADAAAAAAQRAGLPASTATLPAHPTPQAVPAPQAVPVTQQDRALADLPKAQK